VTDAATPTVRELERRMDRLEREFQDLDVDRERLTVSLSELAFSTEATLKVNEAQQKTQDSTLATMQKQNKYLLTVLSMLVLNGGPELIAKVVKLVVSLHTGIDL
jgi:hypothetical protein